MFAAQIRPGCAMTDIAKWILQNQQFAPSESLITIPKLMPGNRQYRFALAELPNNGARRALDSGTLSGLARAGYIEINHLAATTARKHDYMTIGKVRHGRVAESSG